MTKKSYKVRNSCHDRRYIFALGTCCIAFGAGLLPSVAQATEVPVNMCTAAGATAAPISPTGGSGGNVSFTPLNPTASLKKNSDGLSGVASVDPSTGALIYTKTDLSVGSGTFPASLAINRTFNSRTIRDNGRPAFRAGGGKWYPFGFGSTHDLDIRFQASDIYFGTTGYGIITIQFGFNSVTFQACSNGYVNMKGDGSRLYRDNTFTNGLRYETRDGDRLFFQGMPQSANGGPYYCGGSTRGAPACGYIRRWVAANGERADFSYDQYYSNPTNATSPAGNRSYAMTGQGTAQECHITTTGVQDCRYINQPWYVMRSGQTYGTSNYPVYDVRLKEVTNSRGYKLTFDYLDPTVDVRRVCGDIGDATTCGVYNNAAMERNRVAKVTGWIWRGSAYQELSTVRYGYDDPAAYNRYYLRSITAPDNSVTRIEGFFDLYEPGQSVAAIKPTWVMMIDDYYYPHADEVYSTADYGSRSTYYPAVTALKRGNDNIVQYNSTLAGRWLPDAYGNWRWQTFISRMHVVDSSGTTTYDYLDDDLSDHYGPSTVTDARSNATKFTYSPLGTLLSQTSPEGVKTSFGYDVRGNLLWRRTDPKPGSNIQPITLNAGYVGSETLTADQCVNQITCNKLLWSKDGMNNRSDYEWEGATGGLSRKLGPVLSDGSRAETTILYTSFNGMSGETFSLPSDVGTRLSPSLWKHELFEYGDDVRHLLVGIVQSADNETLRKCLSYDLVGNVISETAARAARTVCQ